MCFDFLTLHLYVTHTAGMPEIKNARDKPEICLYYHPPLTGRTELLKIMQFTGGRLWELENAHSNLAIENRTPVDTNFRITKM